MPLTSVFHPASAAEGEPGASAFINFFLPDEQPRTIKRAALIRLRVPLFLPAGGRREQALFVTSVVATARMAVVLLAPSLSSFSIEEKEEEGWNSPSLGGKGNLKIQ